MCARRGGSGSVALWMGRVPGRCYSKQGDGHICRGCRQLPPEMKNKIPRLSHRHPHAITQNHSGPHVLCTKSGYSASSSSRGSIPIHARRLLFNETRASAVAYAFYFGIFSTETRQFFGRFFIRFHFFSPSSAQYYYPSGSHILTQRKRWFIFFQVPNHSFETYQVDS